MWPAGVLCDLVTRGPAWPPMNQCGGYKRAVGHVAGEAYCLLRPIWDEHPDLNPGSRANTDPLGFAKRVHPAETSPAGLIAYVEEIERVLPNAIARMLADPSIGKHKEFIENSARDLEEAIAAAKRVFGSRPTPGPG